MHALFFQAFLVIVRQFFMVENDRRNKCDYHLPVCLLAVLNTLNVS